MVTDDKELYKTHPSEKINYSPERTNDAELFLQPCGLLHQSNITPQPINCFEWNGTVAFYQTNDDIGFDIFSAVFYCISRYEEYREHEPDEYGRYAHWNSWTWKNNCVNQPLVDQWLEHLSKYLQTKFPNSRTQKSSFQFIPTYDIDLAWSYLHKGFWRSMGSSVFHPSSIAQRLKVLSGKDQDPFDSYDWLNELQEANKLMPLYFFPVAEQQSELDKNISPKQKALHQLISQTAQKAEVGFHPSVFSHTAKEYLLKEKETLQQILQQTITKSRYHYLKFHLPHSYRELIATGITDDFSMGYGTVNGFRASTSNSFLWYDLENEETTSLRIHPFAFMEANSFYELNQSPSAALLELKSLTESIQNVNGTLITIFHNHFLGTDKMFAGWREMYLEFIRLMGEESPIIS